MKHPRNTNIHDALERQLREQAPMHRRSPSPEMHSRIMAAVRRVPAAPGGESIVGRPHFVSRRLLAAAAMILVVATVSLVLRPKGGHEPAGMPPVIAVDDTAIDGHPQLVQSLIDMAPRFAFDVSSPFDNEADRMLADARQASRIILDNLPFRGRAADDNEARGF